MGKAKKLVYGVGINDADYTVKLYEYVINESGERVKKWFWRCPYYTRWQSMLSRCYSVKYHERHPSYIDCEVCEEWKTFSNFKEWMSSQKWEGKCLDKDLKVKFNKIYSPDTCLFVETEVNNFVLDKESARGQWPLGVYYHKPTKKFIARCSNSTSRKQEHLGYFDTPEEAHEAWKKRKRELCLVVTDDKMLQELLIRRYE